MSPRDPAVALAVGLLFLAGYLCGRSGRMNAFEAGRASAWRALVELGLQDPGTD